jgi:signal transduction histidine kinase
MSRRLHFKTNTLLKNLIGKDLINDDNIAVVELVKNAYDAGSESVLIKFERLFSADAKEPSRLIIVDRGSGMDASDLRDKWLNIAYSEKKWLPKEHGAFLAGNKGIGRFSCDRLGEDLDLLTRKKGGKLYRLKINWPLFEKEGKKNLTIQQIPLALETISDAEAKEIADLKMPPQGTILVISQLRSEWDRDKLLSLKRSLEKFLNPNQLFQRKSFDIALLVDELKDDDTEKDYLDRVNGPVENRVFKNLEFNATYIESYVDPEGEELFTVLRHNGDDVFRLREKNYLNLKNVKVVIYYLNPYKKAYFKRQTGTRSIEFGSIFLFLNGFRISPYGERGDDWLGLDVRKAQGQARYLSSRELVGRIEVEDSEDHFKPISSREGLKKTPEFVELKEQFILETIKRLEKFVVDGLDWDSIPRTLRDEMRAEEGLDWEKTVEQYVESWDKKKQRIALSIMEFIGSSPERIIHFWFNPRLLEGVAEQRTADVLTLIEEVEGYKPGQVEVDLKQSLSKIRRLIAKKVEEASAARTEAATLRVRVSEQRSKLGKLEKETETYRAQTLFLRSVSSLDATQLVAFHHEIVQNSNIVDNYVGKAIKQLRNGFKPEETLRILEKISLVNKRITAIAQFATKANFRSIAGKELTDIPAFVEQYITNVARDFIGSGLKLEVVNIVSEPFEIKARRIELSILIDNIISNSNKAQATSLRVTISKTGQHTLLISFLDDGKGLSDAIKDPADIFELGVTTTAGSGLGLHYAKQIVDELGGVIDAHPSRPKGLEIRIELIR